MPKPIKEAIAALDQAIRDAADSSELDGMVVDWVVCIATRDVAMTDDERDGHTVGYLTDSEQGVPDYRTIGLLEYCRDIVRREIIGGDPRTIE